MNKSTDTQPDNQDSPALDGMLKQLAREDNGKDKAFVDRIMTAVQAADIDIHPPVIVIPRRYIALAASVLLVIGLGMWGMLKPEYGATVTSNAVYVKKGETLEKRRLGETLYIGDIICGNELSEFQLKDGSLVTIDTNTELTIRKPKSLERLNLALNKGRCLLRVSKGKGRFLIDAGVPVDVLGTTFGVRRDTDETVVAVYEGRVQMGGDTGIILTRGKSGRVEYGSRHPMAHPLSPNQELAWSRPEIAFIDRPLSEVLRWITQNSSYTFVIADPELQKTKVSFGLKRNENLSATLQTFMNMHGLIKGQGFNYTSGD
ncbi:hypothetical protein BVX99_00975 [bacterium F16]|nr:hypothetical protein BVX99_00975 [bacterium F16]